MLISSNVKANTGFYNSLGFQTVATVFLGDDPDWHESLVPVAIVSTSTGRLAVYHEMMFCLFASRWCENRRMPMHNVGSRRGDKTVRHLVFGSFCDKTHW